MMDDDDMNTAPDHETDTSQGAPKAAKETDDPKGKTDLDKPATGEGDFAVDEQGTKNVRGPEGHGKEKHDREK